MAHGSFVETYAIYAEPISFSDCYGNRSEQDAVPWQAPAEVPAICTTEYEMALLWCHEDMNSPCWWNDNAYMALEGV